MRALHHASGEASPKASWEDKYSSRSFFLGQTKMLLSWPTKLRPQGLTVTLEAVGNTKASKGQCPDSRLFRI